MLRPVLLPDPLSLLCQAWHYTLGRGLGGKSAWKKSSPSLESGIPNLTDHLLQGKFISRYAKPSQSQPCNGNCCQHAVAVPRPFHRGTGRTQFPGLGSTFAADPNNPAPGRSMLVSAVPSHTPVPAHPVPHHESQPLMSKQGRLKKTQV